MEVDRAEEEKKIKSFGLKVAELGPLNKFKAARIMQQMYDLLCNECRMEAFSKGHGNIEYCKRCLPLLKKKEAQLKKVING